MKGEVFYVHTMQAYW